MDDLKIGVIGVGGRGLLAREAHAPGNGARVVAGMDVSDRALQEFKNFFGPEVWTTRDHRELLKLPELDAVFICSPDFMHEEQALAALRVGKAVYLEKPLAITLEGCDRLLQTAFDTGSRLYVGHNMRHMPVIRKMKELIDSGLIGEIQAGWCRHFVNYGGDAYFRDWHSEQKNTTGLLLQKGAHDIDVMHWLMGGHTQTVVGMGMLSVYNHCERRTPDAPASAAWHETNWPPLAQTGFSPVIDIEDHNMIMMQLDNGKQACYMQCHYTPDSERNYTFIGTKGRLENIGDHDQCAIHVWTERGSRATPDLICQLKPAAGSHGGADPQIVREFMHFVRHGGTTDTSPVAARNAVAVGVLGHDSMRHGCNARQIPALSLELRSYFAQGQMK